MARMKATFTDRHRLELSRQVEEALDAIAALQRKCLDDLQVTGSPIHRHRDYAASNGVSKCVVLEFLSPETSVAEENFRFARAFRVYPYLLSKPNNEQQFQAYPDAVHAPLFGDNPAGWVRYVHYVRDVLKVDWFAR